MRVSIRTNLHENPSSPRLKRSSSRHHSPASLTRLKQHSLFEQQGTGSRRMESKDIISRAMPTNTGLSPQKRPVCSVAGCRASCRVFLILGEPAAADRGTSARNPEAMSSSLLGHASSVKPCDCHTTEFGTDYRIMACCLSPIIIFSDPAPLNEFLNGFTSLFSSAVGVPEYVAPFGGRAAAQGEQATGAFFESPG